MPSEIIANKMMAESEKEVDRIKDRISVCISREPEDRFKEEYEVLDKLYTIKNEKPADLIKGHKKSDIENVYSSAYGWRD